MKRSYVDILHTTKYSWAFNHIKNCACLKLLVACIFKIENNYNVFAYSSRTYTKRPICFAYCYEH